MPVIQRAAINFVLRAVAVHSYHIGLGIGRIHMLPNAYSPISDSTLLQAIMHVCHSELVPQTAHPSLVYLHMQPRLSLTIG